MNGLLTGPGVKWALGAFLGLGVFASAAVIQLDASIEGQANPFKEFNRWLNSFIYSESLVDYCDEKLGETGGHIALTYFRDLIAGYITYFIVAAPWAYYVYIHGKGRFSEVEAPSRETVLDQVRMACVAVPAYATLPVASQLFIEGGYTRVYYSLADVGGLGGYLFFTAVYIAFVEIGIYWMHRVLHTNKFLYKHVHALHHKYNKPSTLTPWASIAFNPLDGLLQACPYLIATFFVPCHYLTHLILLFFTALWATNIHDTLNGDSEPIMGSKYHLIHHTHYHCNFGQFFIFCDWFWGTLKRPEDLRSRKAEAAEDKKKL
mmetsp:Transcript_10562/g.17061  ORF Transcript_10562/g.17061 Transcript_10562/m.17061 type:complete len:319 (-) Transcript_10562:240-1196(-)|eukprot:CAMPEP_0194575328 /NCGR_PEP_ID=MMETSP0292-20121207/10842_1 /TAXON_ID=39354 /ORGANISM="Heterosigma akashiwo, Strain CCMP2393" /LENGTH=318 /DNA_ID=CAMNT_0039427065 /DNA_START=439 /DNA_END=1395 /DNA_ORIENTATION=+